MSKMIYYFYSKFIDWYRLGTIKNISKHSSETIVTIADMKIQKLQIIKLTQ